MLQLNTPMVSAGCLSGVAIAKQGVFFSASQVVSGAVIGPHALLEAFREIDNLSNFSLPTEDTPTNFAREKAKRLLSAAQGVKPIILAPAVVEGSDGDLLIHWDTPFKSVVLICPSSDNKAAQIYREELNGKKAAQSRIGDASGEALAAALSWVLQPR